MRLCRFEDNRLGIIEADEIADVTKIFDEFKSHKYPLPNFDPYIANLGQLLPELKSLARNAKRVKRSEVKLLSPLANPGKVIAAPVNYVKHLVEAREDPEIHFNNQISEIRKAGLFLKATSSVVGPDEGVTIVHSDRRTDHEVELVAVIGKLARNVSESEALDYVAGYTIGLDMSVRGTEDRSFRKSQDSFTVLGPWLSTIDELDDVTNLQLSLAVNGEMRQSANTKDLVLNLPQLIALASKAYTLYPGDIIMTGTPEGVGPVKVGDTIIATIENLGTMTVAVRAAHA